MARSTLMLILVALLVLGAVFAFASRPTTTATSVSTEQGTRVDAPGTTVQTDRDQTRIQAPGVDITVPRDKDGD